MAPTGDAYHVDWVWSNNSNVHVANHRDWFITFTEFKSTAYAGLTTDPKYGLEALGVGNVELNVKTKAQRTGRGTHRTIVLKDVLYCPKAPTNILGQSILHEYNRLTDGQGGKLKDKQTGGTIALLDFVTLWKIWLVGHRKGDSSLDAKRAYWIIARWPDEERKRWLLNDNAAKPSDVEQDPSKQPELGAQESGNYTTEEKRWLKQMYGGEFQFLRDYGLSIYKDEDREEGRGIARALIKGGDMDIKNNGGDDKDKEEEGDNQFLADLEADPTSHFADRHFNEEQLDWIQKHFRHSGNFLIIHGLKFYDDNDCKKGVALAKVFMSDDAA